MTLIASTSRATLSPPQLQTAGEHGRVMGLGAADVNQTVESAESSGYLNSLQIALTDPDPLPAIFIVDDDFSSQLARHGQ